jgi:pimeloyl-[acyl-carrier protein] methyl ester esterase
MNKEPLPLVFLHGWGQSKRIWFQQRKAFPDATFINLPGHGGAADAPCDQWFQIVADQLPDEPAVLVGWSLGGMLAMEIACRWPERIAALALIASTPSFRLRNGWAHGCDQKVFSDFEKAVVSQSPKIMNRFFALMMLGDGLSRSAYNALARQAVNRQSPTTEAGIATGLELLSNIDLRDQIHGLHIPALVMHGEQDAIVPFTASLALAEDLPDSRLQAFSHCGHAPFLTQPEAFNTSLSNWWQTL